MTMDVRKEAHERYDGKPGYVVTDVGLDSVEVNDAFHYGPQDYLALMEKFAHLAASAGEG